MKRAVMILLVVMVSLFALATTALAENGSNVLTVAQTIIK